MSIDVGSVAYTWYQNGDHPMDGVLRGSTEEGRVVRRYRCPGNEGHMECECGRLFHDHGWLDTGEDGETVCPGDMITWSHEKHAFIVADEAKYCDGRGV